VNEGQQEGKFLWQSLVFSVFLSTFAAPYGNIIH